MFKYFKSYICIGSLFIIFNSAAVFAQGRYNLPADYVEDISAVKAYFLTQKHHHKKNSHHVKHSERPIILDVRDVEEYSTSHAKKALSIPYPHIYKRPGSPDYISQDPKTFFDAVAEKLSRDKVILIVCRSGYRSNLAGNILANPSAWVPEYQNMNIERFTQVYNVWEGMVGRYRIAIEALHETVPIIHNTQTGEALLLDLNHNGVLDDGDKDGWLGHLDLPYSTTLDEDLLYEPYEHLYIQN